MVGTGMTFNEIFQKKLGLVLPNESKRLSPRSKSMAKGIAAGVLLPRESKINKEVTASTRAGNNNIFDFDYSYSH